MRESGVGWLVPMNRPEKVAAKIAELHNDRAALADASVRAAAVWEPPRVRKDLQGTRRPHARVFNAVSASSAFGCAVIRVTCWSSGGA